MAERYRSAAEERDANHPLRPQHDPEGQMNDLVATLKTMFRNCMDNAAKVTSEGGSLEYMQDVGAENSARHAIEAVCEDLEAYANGAVSINPQYWLTAKRREISRP